MAEIIVYSVFINPVRYEDPQDDRIYGSYYDEQRFTYETDTPDAQPRYESFAGAYNDFLDQSGPPPPYIFEGEVWARCLPGTTTRRAYLHNGDGTITAQDDPNSTTCGFGALAFVRVTPFSPAQGQTTGRVLVEVSGGVLPLSGELQGGGTNPGLTFAANSRQAEAFGLNPGAYLLRVLDSSPAQQVITFYFDIDGPPDPGCDNPDADNYRPNARPVDNTLCIINPKLSLDPLADLVPLGRPVEVTLHSAEIVYQTPQVAIGDVRALNPPAGATLTLNGNVFAVGTSLGPGFFTDTESLFAAISAVPALVARYELSYLDANTLRLTARTAGTADNLTIAASTNAGLEYATYPGRNAYHSQRRIEWGCWLEVYAVPGVLFGPSQPKTGAVLAGAFESRLRADNTYSFDIAEALRQFTSLDYDVAGRLTGYFLRFGETYADTAGGFRKRRVVGESNVLFGLEAVEIMPPSVLVDGSGVVLPVGFPYVLPIAFDSDGAGNGTLAGWRRLSRQPGRVALAGVLTTLLNPTYGGLIALDRLTRQITGQQTADQLADFLTTGAARTLTPAQMPAGAGTERITTSLAGTPLVVAEPLVPGSFVLTFANGQGGNDSVAFSGLRLPQAKRTSTAYATRVGRRTFAAEVPDTYRLNSGLLSAEKLDWLVRELGNSAAVWLETDAGPVAVNLTDFDVTADRVEGEYTLSLECQPCEQPALGLTN